LPLRNPVALTKRKKEKKGRKGNRGNRGMVRFAVPYLADYLCGDEDR
jgi:hypothetical protein